MKKRWKLREALQFNHVNRQMFGLTILTITIPLLIISTILYIESVDAAKNEYRNSSELILTNLSYNIDQYLQSIEYGTLIALMDERFQSALDQWTQPEADHKEDIRIQYGNVIEDFVSTIEVTVKNVDSVQIYAADSIFYSVNFNRSDYKFDDFQQEQWYQETLTRKGGIVIFGTHQPFHRVDAKAPVISIARVINKVGTRKPLGVLLVDIRLDSLREILAMSENYNRRFLIVDSKGKPIYSSDGMDALDTESVVPSDFMPIDQVLIRDEGNFYARVRGEESFINFVTSPYSGWKVIQYIDEKEMTRHAKKVQNIVLALTVASFCTALLFLYVLYRRVTKPIIFLSKQVKKLRMGNFNVDLRSNRNDEFGVLYHGIAKMVEELQAYIERTSTARAQQKVAQFGALKSQINPHFLANALETIQMKAVIAGIRDIGEMIGLLGRLFRSYIQTGKETVTLEEELEHIRLYVKVQQMRFGERIQYEERLDARSKAAQIVHFSLQPIVENAIVHGLEQKGDPGLLEVISEIEGRELVITVRDNGVGMDAAQLSHLQHRLEQSPDTLYEKHIGLKNVHDRIRFYFGNEYGIDVQSRPHEGTTVTLRMPYIRLSGS